MPAASAPAARKAKDIVDDFALPACQPERVFDGGGLREAGLSLTLSILPMRSARFQFWFGYWHAVNAASGPRLLY